LGKIKFSLKLKKHYFLQYESWNRSLRIRFCLENISQNATVLKSVEKLHWLGSVPECLRTEYFSVLMLQISKTVCLTVRRARSRPGKKVKFCTGIHASHCHRSERPVT